MFVNDLTDLLTASNGTGDSTVEVGILGAAPFEIPGVQFLFQGVTTRIYMDAIAGPPPLGSLDPTMVIGPAPTLITQPVINDTSRIYLDGGVQTSKVATGVIAGVTLRTAKVGARLARLKGSNAAVAAPMTAGVFYTVATGLIRPTALENITCWTTAGQHVLAQLGTTGALAIRATAAVAAGQGIIIPSHLYDTQY